MPLLALPSSTALVQRVVWLHLFKASGAYKDPPLRIIDENTVKYIVRLLPTLTGLGSNAFYWHRTVANALSSGPRKLQLDGNPDIAGEQTKNFKTAELFKFLAPTG